MRGYDLVALIFAREVNDPLTSLVKRLDRELVAVGSRNNLKRGVFVIYCNDNSAAINEQLKALAAREGLERIVLCSTSADGPKRYKIAREADTTVVIYDPQRKVATNLVLRKGDLSEPKADEIFRGIAAMLRR